MYSGETPILGRGTVDGPTIDAWLARIGPTYAPGFAPDGQYRPAPDGVGNAIVDIGAFWGINWDMLAAQIVHESAAWQSAIARDKNNPSGLGAENDDPYDKAIHFETAALGIRATAAHLMVYAKGDGPWATSDPRYEKVKAKGWLGAATVWNDLNGKWAWPGSTYGEQVATVANALLSFAAAPQRVPKPPMIERHSPNRGGYNVARDIRLIVQHISDDPSIDSVLRYFGRRGTASSNYVIDRDGTIYEVVPLGDAPWTNGDVNDPDMTHPIIADIIRAGHNPNPYSATIENIGRRDDDLTAAQIASNRALMAWIGQEANLPLDRTHVIGHYRINSVSRWYCPGFSDAEWDALLGGNVRLFPETGHGIGGGFRWYWENKGGLEIFGYPLTDEIQEDGMTVQYFERAVFEYHPDNADPWTVLLRRIGAEALERKNAA